MVLLGLTAAYYTISATMRLRWRRGHGRLHGRRRGEAHRLRRGRGGREHGRAAGARHREGHRRLPDGRFRLRGDGHRQRRRPHGALRQLTAAHSWCLRACGAGACATLVLALHQALSTKHQAPRHSRAGGQHTDLPLSAIVLPTKGLSAEIISWRNFISRFSNLKSSLMTSVSKAWAKFAIWSSLPITCKRSQG